MNDSERLTDLSAKALKKWGLDAQRRMAVEECSELIKAICKYERIPCTETVYDIIEELADVSLMINQLRLMFDEDGAFEAYRQGKLDRLERLLGEGE